MIDQKKRINMRLCSIKGCNRKHWAGGFCGKHYQRMRTNGTLVTKRAENGNGYVTYTGYYKYGSKLEHVAIVEKILGKSIPKGVVIHHVE